jgi:hypothetical protein
MAETALLLAPYIAAASGAVSAISAISGGMQQSAALEQQAAADRRNADQARVNAGVALNTAEAEAARTEQQTRRRVATGLNQAAGSGVDPFYGSPLDVLADMSAEGALDKEIIRWKGRNAANAQLGQAGNFETQAGYADQAADDATSAGFVRAGTTVLGAAANYGTMRLRMGAVPGYP